MAPSIDNGAPGLVGAVGGGAPRDAAAGGRAGERRVAKAFRVFSTAGLLLGLLAVASFMTVFARLLESWRVTSHGVSHEVVIVGQRLSYPVANAGAVIVLVLALLGSIAFAVALLAAGRELIAARRLGRRLAALQGVRNGDLLVIDDERPEAFCAGLVRPRVYVTTGALELLDGSSLGAVLGHERQHAWRRDPLRLAATRVLTRSLFFLPGVSALGRSHELLAELSADETAVRGAAGDRSALARAMLAFDDAHETSGVDPVRVDYLLGEPPGWRFPLLMFAVAVVVLALVATLAVLLAREASGSATLAPPVLSAQPCIALLALIPGGAGIILATTLRRRRRLSSGPWRDRAHR